MSSDSVVRARIDGKIKREAKGVLAEMGLSVSDAIRLLLVRIAADRALPFEVRSPTAATLAAIGAARKGEVERFSTVEELMADLNAEN